MKQLTAVIVDNDYETTEILNSFVEENHIMLKIVGYESSVEKSLDLIKLHKPDVIFIDISSKNENFSDYINDLDFNLPKFIFISSDERYALKAFKLNAIDFLIKPLNINDIILSLYKVIKRIEMELCFQEQRVNEVNGLSTMHQNNEYIAISSMDKIELIKMDDIIFCKADGKYTDFFLVNDKKILSSRNLGEYVSMMDPNYFFRIHHSYVVNIKHITKISKKDGYSCELINGISLPIAKRRQEEFIKFIKL
ncbi:LytR/AlgR family response regulator transcription factor [Halpernia frigidisoli]|uniref:Two component transcriptional regulator, LytTR family n=1 Tax=Halpernia frigidisoli TaxID=1125876 RepID=A0A1I3IRN5_9FLAO|nr:LytTR family DNA-binding domain-containing protein [Halpernia frigidisoli]SFI50611.1 two component transcriptional regulator, LytTR family [Halpernia frigidisoli]